MMAANYRHIGGGENRLGRHYSRFSAFWPPQPLPVNHLLCENCRTQGRIGEVGLAAMLSTLEPPRLTKKFHLDLAQPQEIRGCGRYRAIDREHRELKVVARRRFCGEHDAVRHVETLDRVWAGPRSGARHLAVDPDLGIVVDIDPQYRHCAGGIEA